MVAEASSRAAALAALSVPHVLETDAVDTRSNRRLQPAAGTIMSRRG
jgi:hypothetical protein